MFRIIKSIISIILILIFSLSFNVYASNSYIDEARVLYDLGFYNGISQSFFEPDLNSFVDTETAVVFLLRIVKSKSEIQSLSEYDVRNILNSYNDRAQVSEWEEDISPMELSKRYWVTFKVTVFHQKDLLMGKLLRLCC